MMIRSANCCVFGYCFALLSSSATVCCGSGGGLFAEAVGRTLFAEAVCSPDGDGQVSQVIPGAEVSTVLVYSFSPPSLPP
jgi:hypothetical protein